MDTKQPGHSIQTLIEAMPHVPNVWYRFGDHAGMTDANPHVTLNYTVDPIGVLRPASRPTTAPTKRCIQIQVWLHQQLAHSNEQREARERALARDEPDPFPTTLLTSGSVADTAVLGLPVTTLMQGANPSHLFSPWFMSEKVLLS